MNGTAKTNASELVEREDAAETNALELFEKENAAKTKARMSSRTNDANGICPTGTGVFVCCRGVQPISEKTVSLGQNSSNGRCPTGTGVSVYCVHA